MKGNLLALLLAAALLTGSLAAASAEENKSLKIAVAQISLSDEWSTQIADEFTKQCAQRGWDVSIADANMNAEIQQKQIEARASKITKIED
jgi:ABC-type sugar transport system substrate-binding protein